MALDDFMVGFGETGLEENKTKALSLGDRPIVYDCELSDDLEFPLLLIEGVSYEVELKYLRGLSSNDIRPVPLYLFYSEGDTSVIRKVCDIDLTMSALINFKCLGDYKLHLFEDESTGASIDMESAVDLLGFIS